MSKKQIFRLKLARLPGPVPGLLGRAVSVHIDEQVPSDYRPTSISVAVIAGATIVASVAMGAALKSTYMLAVVTEHVEDSSDPVIRRAGRAPELSALPRAFLISEKRGFVQVGAHWESESDVLDFHLSREAVGTPWTVVVVQTAPQRLLANYSLRVPDEDIPAPPGGAGTQ